MMIESGVLIPCIVAFILGLVFCSALRDAETKRDEPVDESLLAEYRAKIEAQRKLIEGEGMPAGLYMFSSDGTLINADQETDAVEVATKALQKGQTVVQNTVDQWTDEDHSDLLDDLVAYAKEREMSHG